MPWWTREEMEAILLQLEDQGSLFDQYRFVRRDGGLSLLGKGAYASVYEAEGTGKRKKGSFAIEVIGFGNKRMVPGAFQKYTDMQSEAGAWQQHVVHLWDYMQIVVRLDDAGRVIGLGEKEGEDGLELQFIVMERLEPVIRREPSGVIQLYPEGLSSLREDEIIRLACDIGQAVQWIHRHNIIHRDIKLENIFYDPSKKIYKLGDFGIAREMERGGAATMAYTYGYGAPEVLGKPEEIYDDTADLYSFGITLYVLLNGLKFPGSDGYWPDAGFQYAKGAVFQKPETGGNRLCEIVLRLCAYDPEDRYPSMKEVMQDLGGLVLPPKTVFQEKHKSVYLVFGVIFLLFGLISWVLKRGDWLMVFSCTNAFLFAIKYLNAGAGIDAHLQNAARFKKAGRLPLRWNLLHILWGILLNGLVPYGDETHPLTILFREGIFEWFGQLHLSFAGALGLLFWGLWWLLERATMASKGYSRKKRDEKL